MHAVRLGENKAPWSSRRVLNGVGGAPLQNPNFSRRGRPSIRAARSALFANGTQPSSNAPTAPTFSNISRASRPSSERMPPETLGVTTSTTAPAFAAPFVSCIEPAGAGAVGRQYPKLRPAKVCGPRLMMLSASDRPASIWRRERAWAARQRLDHWRPFGRAPKRY
jgi:hypothetical protein